MHFSFNEKIHLTSSLAKNFDLLKVNHGNLQVTEYQT